MKLLMHLWCILHIKYKLARFVCLLHSEILCRCNLYYISIYCIIWIKSDMKWIEIDLMLYLYNLIWCTEYFMFRILRRSSLFHFISQFVEYWFDCEPNSNIDTTFSIHHPPFRCMLGSWKHIVYCDLWYQTFKRPYV